MKKPKIRFKGFTEVWEQRKLGELASKFQSGKFISASNISELDEYPVYGGNGLRGYTDTYNHDGEFALIGRQGALCGNVNKSVGKAYFTEHAVVVSGNESNETDFIFHLLSTMNLGQYSDQSAQPGLAVGKLVELKTYVPKLAEQKKISSYFTNLDHLITLHQRKCEETKTLKKYMLQKMFPQNGSDVPEIRFEGFTNAWEQRKFDNIASRKSNSNESTDELPSVEYEDIISGRGLLNKNVYDKETSKTGIKFDEGDVLFGKLRPYLKNWLKPNFPGIAVGDFWVLEPQNMDSSYLYYLIQTPEYDNVANQSSGTKMPRSDWKLVSNTAFNVPVGIDEQQKIGEYFTNLDNLITLHQRTCDELQEIKKFMLQTMFI